MIYSFYKLLTTLITFQNFGWFNLLSSNISPELPAEKQRTDLQKGFQPPSPVIWGQTGCLSSSFFHQFGHLCSAPLSVPSSQSCRVPSWQRARIFLGPGVIALLASDSFCLLSLSLSYPTGCLSWPIIPCLCPFTPQKSVAVVLVGGAL